jgi:hypothetical protein
MKCEEVREYLVDLLDDGLDVERAPEINNHLSNCPLCSEELERLADGRRLVSGLPAVEPPVGFTTRVMAQVREVAPKSGLWEWLFLPLRIKIPLQATAVLLIAVLATYIYQKDPQQRESAVTFQPESSFRKQDETDKLAPTIAQVPFPDTRTKAVAEETKPRVEKFKDSAPGREPQPLPQRVEQEKRVTNNPQPSRDQVPSPSTLSPRPLQRQPSTAIEATSPRLEQSSPSGGVEAKGTLAPAPQSEKENSSKDAATAGKLAASPAVREKSAASSLSPLTSGSVMGAALPTDYELAVRLREPARDENHLGDRLASSRAQAERRSLASQEEAQNLEEARQQARQTGRPETVEVTIARSQYELFKKELTDLGTIEMESSKPALKNDAIAKSSDRVRIKLTILPPLPSENVTPSQPSSR